MTTADVINVAIALGTVAAAVFAGLSARYAATATRDVAQQIKLATNEITLHRADLHAQAFLSLASYEREIEFSRNMDVIRGLQHKPFDEVSEAEQKSIRLVVDFLNHVAHLMRYRYVDPQHILLSYTPSIEGCQDKLIGPGKWLQELRARANNPKLYLHFEALCDEDNGEKIWSGKADNVRWTGDFYKAPAVLADPH
jgi:hypothetical protein